MQLLGNTQCFHSDQFIKVGHEKCLKLEDLKHRQIQPKFLKANLDFTHCSISEDSKKIIKGHYTQSCYNARNTARYRFLQQLVLSPSSYALKKGQKSEGLGCCSTCYNTIIQMKKESCDPDKVPMD